MRRHQFIVSDTPRRRRIQRRSPLTWPRIGRACEPVVEGLESRQMLAVNPLMVYTFNEGSGTTVGDTGTGDAVNNVGTLAGEILPTWGTTNPSPAGGAYLHFDGQLPLFDGTGGRVDLANLINPILGATGSLAAYMRTTQVGHADAWQAPGITGAEQAGAGDDIFWGNLNPTGQMRFQAGDGVAAVSPESVNDGQWHQITNTRNHTTGELRVYVDGVLRASAFGDTGVKGANFRSLGATTDVQGNLTTVDGYNYLNGDLDQVEIYDRVLTPQEVAARFGPNAGGIVPAAPSVTAAGTALRAITLTWNDVPSSLGYSILRSTSGAPGTFTEIAAIPFDATAGATTTYSDRGLTANQTYFYQVVAFNQAGSSVAGTASAVAPDTGNGIAGHYYNSNFWGNAGRPGTDAVLDTAVINIGNPDIRELVGGEINFNYGGGAPAGIRADNFSTVWTGKIVPPETGTYTILGFGDDDTHVFVNGTLVSSDPGGHGIPANDATGLGEIPIKNPITLTGGQEYDLLVLQAEQGGGAGIILRWITPTDADPTNADLVPVSALRPVAGTPAPAVIDSVSVSGNQVIVNFTDNSTSEVRYVLERSLGGDAGPFVPVATGPLVTNGANGAPGAGSITANLPDAGNYTLRLRAVNFDGSSVSNTAAANVGNDLVVPGTGAQGYYFNTQFWGSAVAPPVGQIIVGLAPNFSENVGDVVEDYGGGSPEAGVINNDSFSTVFTGKFVAPETGVYEILGFSDDDSYVWVNGQLVSADPGGHGIPGNDAAGIASIDIKNPITLTAGQEYNFVAIQSEGGGGAGLILRVKTPTGTGFVDVPAAAFSSNIPNATGGLASGAPAAATNVRVDEPERQASFVVLRWNDVATAELRYRVERTGPGTVVTVFDLPINSTSFLDTTVAANTQYTYRVIASNFQGDTASTTTTVTTRAANLAPAAIGNVAVVSRAGGVRVTMIDASLTETEFIIQRAPVTGGTPGTFVEVGRIAGSAPAVQGGSFAFLDTTAVAGQNYAYQVLASNLAGQSPPSNAPQITFTPPTGVGVNATYFPTINFTGTPIVLPDPIDLDEDWGGGGPPQLVADPGNADPDDTISTFFEGLVQPEFSEPYTFYLDSDDGVALAIIDMATGNVLLDYNNLGARRGLGTGFPDTAGTLNLQAGQRYGIVVRVVEDGGGFGYQVGWSSPSTTQEIIPRELLFLPDPNAPLRAPSNVTATAIGTEQVIVNFHPNFANLNETGFEILRSTTGAPGSFTVVATVPANSSTFRDTTNLVNGQTLFYQVRAVRGATQGPVSATSAPVTIAVGGTAVTTNGSATVLPGPDNNPDTTADNQLQLTDNVNDQTGSAFLTNARVVDGPGQGPLGSTGFTSSFDFVIPEFSANPADGFAFVIQRNNPTTIGGGGGGLGATGIPNSVIVEFDIFNAQNEIGVYLNGDALIADDAMGSSQDAGFPFANGHTYRARVEYNADTNGLRVIVSDVTDPLVTPFDFEWFTLGTTTLDISQIVGGNQAYFGFTGATGGENADQRIQNWSVNGEAIPFAVVPQGLVVPAGTTMTVDNIRTTQVTIGAGATLIVRPNGGAAGASKVGTIVFQDATGKINLNDNDIVITGMSAADVRNLVTSGQITTEAPPPAGKTVGLAVAQGNDPNLAASLAGQLSGQSFGPTDILIKYTYRGDADLDGDVDPNDVAVWGVNFTGDLPPGTGTKTWTQGDWDGDGDVDPNDVALWGVNFTGDLPPGTGLSTAAPASAPLLAATPSTGTLANPVAPVTTPAPTKPAPALKPVTGPAVRPTVKPAAAAAAATKPVLKPAAKPAARPVAKPVSPAGRTSPVASLFSSTKIGSRSAGSVLGGSSAKVL